MAIKTYTGGVKWTPQKEKTYTGGVKWTSPDAKLGELSSEVKEYASTLDKYDNTLTTLDEQFKKTPTQELANQYNSVLEKRQSLYKQYEPKNSELNTLIDEHNKNYTKAMSNWKQTSKEQQLEPDIPNGKQMYGFKKVEDTKLSAYKEPEKNIIDKMKAKISGVFKEKPETQIAKSQVSYNISQATGVPATEVEKNLPAYTKELGVRGVPTSEEFLSAMFSFPVAAAIISNPISAGIGVTKFMAMAEAENLIISKVKGWDYKFLAGKGLKELAPEDTNQITKDIIDVVGFIAKGVVIRATDKGTKAMFDKFTKEVITKYSPSQKVYLSSEKIKDLHLNDPKLATQFEKDVYTNLEGKAEAARTAFKRGGIDVEIPAQTITKIADKPYWAKIKSLFNIKPYTKTVVENISGKWSLHPAGLLPSPVTELGAGVTPKQMINSLIETGKVGINVANQIKTMTPEQGIKFIQDLSLASPAIASKLIPELEKLIPQVGKVGEAKKARSVEEFVKAQPKLYHGTGYNFNEFLSAKQLKEKGISVQTANEKTESRLVFFSENKQGAQNYVDQRLFSGKDAFTNRETLKVKEGFPINPILDLTKSTPDNIKLIRELGEKYNLWALKSFEKMGSSNAQITFRDLDEIMGRPAFGRVDMNKLEELLRGENYSGIKFNDKTMVGGSTKAIGLLPDQVRTKQQLTDFYAQTTSGTGEYKADVETIFAGGDVESVGTEPIPEGGEPPATVDKQNSIFNKAAKKIEDVATKAVQIVDIQAPFNKLKAKETGFQIKNYYSNIGWGHQRGLDAIGKLNKVKVNPVTVEESDFKASGELDYTDVTYLSERPGFFVKLDPEERRIASGGKKLSKDFYKFWQDKVTEIGWMEEPFPQSFITRANNKIGGLKKQLKDIKKPEAKQLILDEIKKLEGQVERIKKQKIQFVSIPAKTILSNAETNPEINQRLFSILPKWDRDTITVKDLVDAKVITRKEADIRYIIGEYSDRMGKKYALGKIFETAEKEGLIKPQALVPNWLPARIYINGKYVDIPQLRGKRLEPFFSDTVTDFFSRGVITLGPIMGTIKMMQFHNPVIMPMYDVWQAAAIGVFLNPVKGATYIYNGINDVLKHTDKYYLGYENGLFSKPYAIPYDVFERQFKEAMKGNKLVSTLKKAALPTNWLPMLYHASWHTAWTLDPMVRMMSFNYLLDKGMSPRNAAQLAALYHSDYASVPPATRRTLNKIFFTPTFKVTMAKLTLGMFKSIGKIMAKYPAKFLLGKDIKIYQKDKILARGALIVLGIMLGIRQYFLSQGYKEENLFCKYSKEVETDEGMKENVITLSHPFNIPFRYYGRIKNAWAPSNLNVAEKLVETAKWDLHPMWRVAYDIVNNDYYSIYNPFDEAEIVARDIALHVFTEFVAITKGLLESAEAGEVSAENFRILQKDMGTLKAIILKPFIFNYARDLRKVRAIRDIKRLQEAYSSLQFIDPSKDPKVNAERIENFIDKVNKVKETYEKRETPKTERQKTYTGGIKWTPSEEKTYTGGVKWTPPIK